MEAKLSACQNIIDYTFVNAKEILTALNMSGSSSGKGYAVFENQFVPLDTNTRLAVYGDSIAHAYLCRQWVRTELDKNSWTNMRNAIMGADNLARVGFQRELDHYIILNAGTRNVTHGMMATTVKAILGAVHIDGGDAALATVMGRLGLNMISW